MLRILLDTNILIFLEDPKIQLPKNLSEVVKLASENKCVLLAHPNSKGELKKDKDASRRDLTISKVEK